ncbi:MAG: hypothetical protein AB7P40_11615 [Chloroflexota bacterium]
MLAHHWYDQSIQFDAIGGRQTPAQEDDDAALDDWLASMSVIQFDRMLNVLMDHFGTTRAPLDRPA